MSTALPPVTPVSLNVDRATRPGRTDWIDHLRVALTLLVVLHHVALVYGGSGGWYWKELPEASALPLVVFNAVNQSFFMGFFFLLAGYYTPAAYDRKGTRRFLQERLLRLGVPLVGYFLVLSPLTIGLARSAAGEDICPAWLDVVRRGQFEPGPLWFAEALLLLALGYVGWRSVGRPSSQVFGAARDLPHREVLGVALVIGLANVVVRQWIPVGSTVLWLQLGYFPAYLALFAIGCAVAPGRRLERVEGRLAVPWLMLSLVLIAVMPRVIGSASSLADFLGGWNRFAVFYAFWDPLVAAGIVLGLLWGTRRYLGAPSRVMAWLARRAFGIFIVHPPVVVALGITWQGWTAPAELKFAVVGLLSCAGSALVADLLLRVPGVKRVL